PAAARNAGLRIAKGDLIAFLDADDFWEPPFLERSAGFLTTHRECIAASTGLRFLRIVGHSEVGPALLKRGGNGDLRPFVIENFFEFWADQDHIRTGSAVMRRSVLIEAGLQQENLRFCEDLELWGLLATFGKWGFIPEPLW